MSLSRPETLATAVATYIRDAIVHGQFAPGSRLPEVALAAQLETSRGTVREALRTLADGGLIEVVPRRGVFVSQLSVRATWEITSLRALLEPYASRLALEASGSDHVIRMDVEAAFEVLCAWGSIAPCSRGADTRCCWASWTRCRRFHGGSC
jgi:DNA-binding GntR family transcriptional regulator